MPTYLQDGQTFVHGGCDVRVWFDYEDDNIKVFVDIVAYTSDDEPVGHIADITPYAPTREMVEMYIDLGMPVRRGPGPWTLESLHALKQSA